MTSTGSAPAIIWPEKYLPGRTDNYVSNEVIAKDITTSAVWTYLADITKWESYYDNCGQITPPKSSNFLSKDDAFKFSTFGFPPLDCKCTESISPEEGNGVGRLAWAAWNDAQGDKALDVLHAWLIEDLGDGRVRILTQESQIGVPAKQLAETQPNPMLNAHQRWLDGLVKMVRGSKM